jgi:hypothetical protein
MTSIVWSADRSATLRATFIYVEAVVAYLFVIRELAWVSSDQVMTYVRRYAYLIIIPGVLLLLHVPGFAPRGDLKHSSGGYLTYYTRFSHPVLGGSNNIATLLAFASPILFYWGHTRHDRRCTIAGYVTLAAIALTLSRGILLSFVVAAVVFVPFASRARGGGPRRFARSLLAAALIAAIAIGVFYSVNPPTRELFSSRFSVTNVETRSELVSLSVAKIALRPMLGYGGGVNPAVDPLTSYQLATGRVSANAVPPAQAAPFYYVKLDTHNAYLQQAVYFGLPLGLVVSVALWGIAAFFVARQRYGTPAAIIGYTLLVQLVSFCFESSFEGTVLRVLFYLSIGFAVALLRAVENEAPAPSPA